MKGWEYGYDREFAHVYGAGFDERADLSWDGSVVKLDADGVLLDLRGVDQLHKLLGSVLRDAKRRATASAEVTP